MFENLNDIADAKSPTLIPAPIHVSQLILNMHRAKIEREIIVRPNEKPVFNFCMYIYTHISMYCRYCR